MAVCSIWFSEGSSVIVIHEIWLFSQNYSDIFSFPLDICSNFVTDFAADNGEDVSCMILTVRLIKLCVLKLLLDLFET